MTTRENDWPFVSVSKESPYAVLMLADGVGGLPRIYVQPREQLGKPGAQWREVIGEAAKVRRTTHSGKWLYGRSFDGAARYRVLRWDLSRPEAAPVEAVPQQTGVIEDIGAKQRRPVLRGAQRRRVGPVRAAPWRTGAAGEEGAPAGARLGVHRRQRSGAAGRDLHARAVDRAAGPDDHAGGAGGGLFGRADRQQGPAV
ncbi:hypothetical protein LP419_10480 [Massilia sp. H-1]|nr:hypothetical protein LP419_10480 [Massilia sp. H-1]